MSKTDESRGRILAAAEELFGHYGFAKTTMAEIAARCGMSAANIYRFFEKKEDIIAEMAGRYFRRVEDSLRAVLKRPGRTPSERLEDFVVEMLSQSHRLCFCEDKMSESVGFIIHRRTDLVERHREIMRSLLAEILAEGNQAGEFAVEDVVGSSGVILDATFMYQTQGCVGTAAFEELKASAVQMVGLLVRGLGKR